MAISRLSEDEFRAILKQYLTPARAIVSPQHLKGRAKTLTQIDRAFNSPGKHIFIYGDRGVGKTSLAQTAASLRQSSDAEPILVSCGGAPFLSTVRDAVKQAIPVGDAVFQKKVETKLRAGIGGFGYDMTRSLTSGVVPAPESVNDAVQLLRFVGEFHSREPVIIFDEFDQLADDAQRKICADVIKQASERAPVRFIFCGIGSSLKDLIGVHLSTGRYLSPVELERLTHDARWQQAVQETETTLKIIYDRATQKYSDDYQEVLWAIADDHLLRRQTSDIFEKSYLRIMAERPHRKKLTKQQFSDRLNKLKTARHGEIILGKGAGWYEFRENIVRGYVRLRAESEGVQIGVEGYG